MKNKRVVFIPFFMLLAVGLVCFSACFKDLPNQREVYFNNFEDGEGTYFKVYDYRGELKDSVKLFSFNNSKVFGRFNNNLVELKLPNLGSHNVVKIEFDLYIHDKWDGDHLIAGSTVPDAWQMTVDDHPFYITTFSNGPYGQSFPNNYKAGAVSNPAHADAWDISFPGVCALKDAANGSSLYKIELITSHARDSIKIACNDALQPFNSLCQKSWSIDNIRVTAITHH